ncbi:MAG: MarR family transcriptional regulator [Candidatus Promineifilaceae bacterium]|nr:MarR family transcriptional regulator [Candidatus Promineifilaceae bacterium]
MTHSLGSQLISLCRAHRKILESELNEIGLYAGQEILLLRLLDLDGQSQSELALSLNVEAPTMTRVITRLERVGLVQRRADREDKRVSRVFLTERGRQLEDDIHQIWDRIEAQLSSGLSEAEVLLLQRLLTTMRANLLAE